MDVFVQDKLIKWNLGDYIKSFEDELINYETFLSLDSSDRLERLIPKAGPRAKFRKRLQEFKQSPIRHHDENMDTNIYRSSVEEDGNEMNTEPSQQTLPEQGGLATQLFVLRHRLTAPAQSDLMTVFKSLLPNFTENSFRFNKIMVTKEECDSGTLFLFSSLKDLLKDTLKCCGTKLLPKAYNGKHDFNDIMDGKAYQNLLQQNSLSDDDITLLWNCDGVPVQHFSIWPLQFTINELPYQIWKQNVLVPALWFTTPDKSPKMKIFLKPFIDECKDLAKTPLEWTDANGTVRHSRVFALVCSSDAVARPLLRNSKQFNGEYGCDWCLHPGIITDKRAGKVRTYTYNELMQRPRFGQMFHSNAREAEQLGEPVNGVKGLSVIQELPNLDIVFGFVPEYSHVVLVGVTKQLVFLWLEEENSSKPWYIGNKLDELDTNLLGLKPGLKTIRTPISLKCREKWKAVDWQAFLLFYGIYVLEPYLPPKFYQNFHLLSCGTHMLLQDCVSQDILTSAHIYLVRFVRDVGRLYGEEHVTFNCHQLIHLHESVQNWGPLWATSALGFERNNKDLQALLRDVVEDSENTFKKFSIWQNIPNHVRCHIFRDSDFESLINSVLSPLKPCNTGFTPLEPACNTDLQTNLAVEDLVKQKVFIKAFERFTNGHIEYHCLNSSNNDKTKCTIKLKNGQYGVVHSFIEAKTQGTACPVIVARMFDTSPVFGELDIEQTAKMMFVKGEITERLKAFFVHDIKSECVNVNGLIVCILNTKDRF